MKSFDDLPAEKKDEIFKLLDLPSAGKGAQVSKEWNSFFKSAILKKEFLKFLLENKTAYKRTSLEHIAAMKDLYLNEENDRKQFFTALKTLESKIISIIANPLFHSREKLAINWDDELRPFFLKEFGIAGLMHSYSVLSIMGSNGIESRAKELAPLTVLEKQLQENPDENMEALKLINSLFENRIIKLSDGVKASYFEFNDNKLWFYSSGEKPVQNFHITIDDIISLIEEQCQYQGRFRPMVSRETNMLFEKFKSEKKQNLKLESAVAILLSLKKKKRGQA